MNYLAIINDKQVGPYPVEQLVQLGIGPNCYVWCQGMPEWKEAGTVPEFAETFSTNSVPPTAPPAAFSGAINKFMTKTSTVSAFLPILVLALCLLVGIFDTMIFRETQEDFRLENRQYFMQTGQTYSNSPQIHNVPTVLSLCAVISMIGVLISTYFMWMKYKKNLIINIFATATALTALIFTIILIFSPNKLC